MENSVILLRATKRVLVDVHMNIGFLSHANSEFILNYSGKVTPLLLKSKHQSSREINTALISSYRLYQ